MDLNSFVKDMGAIKEEFVSVLNAFDRDFKDIKKLGDILYDVEKSFDKLDKIEDDAYDVLEDCSKKQKELEADDDMSDTEVDKAYDAHDAVSNNVYDFITMLNSMKEFLDKVKHLEWDIEDIDYVVRTIRKSL